MLTECIIISDAICLLIFVFLFNIWILTGLSNTSGRIVKKPEKAKEDARTIALLRKAGAIPLLVSNTPEYCTNYETWSKAHGTTNNPYDVRRTCGGSSGGEVLIYKIYIQAKFLILHISFGDIIKYNSLPIILQLIKWINVDDGVWWNTVEI